MGYTRAAGLGIGEALGAAGGMPHEFFGMKVKRPSWYAKQSTLHWSNSDARNFHDLLVEIDSWWVTVMGAWRQIPGLEFALNAAGFSSKMLEQFSKMPCPHVAVLGVVFECAFGGRSLEDSIRGFLRLEGSNLVASAGALGIIGVVAAFTGVGLVVTGIIAAIDAVAVVLSWVCFSLAGDDAELDCAAFSTAVTSTSAAAGHEVSEDAAGQGCAALKAAQSFAKRNDPKRLSMKARAKEKAKAKTALAVSMARSLGVTFGVLFTAASANPAVAAWVDACFVALGKRRRMPAPPAAVVAAIPGATAASANALASTPGFSRGKPPATTATPAGGGSGVPLEAPASGWLWWLLGGLTAAGAGVALWRRL